MKFVRAKERRKESFLERLIHKITETKVIAGGHILATFTLSRNPKVGRGWVARVKNLETGELEFLNAYKWTYSGGKYVLEPGDLIIEKVDDSSWRHSDYIYTLYKISSDGKPVQIAWIGVEDKAPKFPNETMEEIYATMPSEKGKSRVIQTLLTYYKTQVPKEVEKLEVPEKTQVSESL